MTAELSTKIRLVRCPKCRQLLPELPDHTLYKCGGCGTILQAKNRKHEVKSKELGLHETDAAQTNELHLATEDKKDFLPSSGKFPSDQNNKRDVGQPGDGNSEQLGDINLSDKDHNSGHNQMEPRDSKDEKLRGTNLSNDDERKDIGAVESCDRDIKQRGASHEMCLSAELAPHRNEESSTMAAANSDAKENVKELPLTEASSELVTNEGDSNVKGLNTDNLAAATASTSVVTHHGQPEEDISPDTLASFPNKQLEHPQGTVGAFDRILSSDTIEAAEFANPSSDLSGGLREMPKSPTTRSYYAYEGSVSSYDGTDDQFPEHPPNSSRSSHKVADFTLSEERQKKGKFLMNNMMAPKYPVGRGISSSTKKHVANKHNKMHQDDLLEPTTYGSPVRNWRRHERENYPSRVHNPQPLYGMSSLAGYEDGGPSYPVHNQFHRNTSFQSSDRSDYPAQDKMRLLQIVSELQEEISKRCSLDESANRRVSTWEENHIPTYCDHEALEGEFRNDLVYPRIPGRGWPGSGSLQQRNFSHMPFSGEETTSRHEVHRSCPQCYPHEWQRSAQLPPPCGASCYNKGLRRVHPGHRFYNSSYGSCPSSPQRYMDSEFPIRSRETKSEEQRHKDHEMRRHHLAKRHVRPIAGGAPFITCYNCSTQLLVPADFLLFRKRFHRLRCGACSELLKFSLENRIHLVPFEQNTMVPPPSEVDDYGDAINGRFVPAAHGHPSANADPVSYSDDYDYGLSYSKSYSTEGDPPPFTSMHALPGNAYERSMLPDPFKPTAERQQSVLTPSRNKHKYFAERHDSAGPSSYKSKAETPSSEIERRATSPLHRLMGYSSPSEVINGCGPTGARERFKGTRDVM